MKSAKIPLGIWCPLPAWQKTKKSAPEKRCDKKNTNLLRTDHRNILVLVVGGIYCQLGDYMPPTIFYGNQKQPLNRTLDFLGLFQNQHMNVKGSSSWDTQTHTFKQKMLWWHMWDNHYPLVNDHIAGWKITIFNRIHTSTQSGAPIFQPASC